MTSAPIASAGGWPGVDEHVVRPFAEAAGRAPTSLIPMPEGDLLLFAFLCAGIIGGWFLGYYYRVLFVEAPGGQGSLAAKGRRAATALEVERDG